MTTFATDPAETRVIYHQTAETAVIRRDVGEKTKPLNGYLPTAPVSPLPRYETAQHAALPHREGVVLPDQFQPPLPGEPPAPPPTPIPTPPLPTPPTWTAPTGWYPTMPAPYERVAGPDETEVVSLLGAFGGDGEPPRLRRSVPYVKPEGYVRTVRRAAPAPRWLWALAGAGGMLALIAAGVLVSVHLGVQW